MKTYTIEVSAERALPILEAERDDLAEQLTSLNARIAQIRMESGIDKTTTNGHPVRKRVRSVVSVLSEGADQLGSPIREAFKSHIKKTNSGRAAKGETEATIMDYLKADGHGPTTAPVIANAVNANYSTVNRSLKKLKEHGHVVLAHGLWCRSDKLKERS